MSSESQITHLLRQWRESLWQFLPHVLSAVLVLLLFWLLARLGRHMAARMDERLARMPGHLRVGRALGWALYGFFMLSGVFLALDALNLTGFLTHLLAGAGIEGIVSGFAFKDIASNLFAGLLVRSQRPFMLGDWVELNGAFGQVREITTLTTAIDTIQGRLVYVPNQLIYSANFTNYSRLGKARVVVKGGVSYGDDLAHVQTVALDEMRRMPCRLSDESVDFYFTDIGSSTYNFEVRFWIRYEGNAPYLAAMSEAIMRLKTRFDAEQIDLAYNVMTLDFGVKGGVNLGDRVLPVQLREAATGDGVPSR